jgi:hypothetical protein
VDFSRALYFDFTRNARFTFVNLWPIPSCAGMFAVPVCYRGSSFVQYAVSARKRLSVSFDILFLRTASVPAIPGAAHVFRCKRRGADIVFFIEAQKHWRYTRDATLLASRYLSTIALLRAISKVRSM